MGILDNAAGALGGSGMLNNVDVDGLAAKVGLDPAQVQQILAALGQQQAQPGDTAEGTAAQTGLPLDKIQQLIQHVGGEGALGKLGGMLGGIGQA